MPIYEYACQTCGLTFEKRQSFNDEPKADCPNGHEETRRLIVAPAIVFKGSGFYINDSKANKSSVNGVSSKKESDSESKADSKSEANSESKKESKSDSNTESKKESPAESKKESSKKES